MSTNQDAVYQPASIEPSISSLWDAAGAFHAAAGSGRQPYSIVIPPPNVTGSLHMGHAVNNALQDVLIRWKRMQGFEACWIPGTDHAGIATQNVVEKELKKEGQTRWDLGREKFLDRVWAWKEQYGNTILHQLRKLGCSCDWPRTRFTMDPGYTRAVRAAFKRFYERGLIYRGRYVINWCPRCLTALSDIEVEHEKTKGFLWYLRYPLDGGAGHVSVATTRPETMLGDTAVAVNPSDPRYRNLVGRTVRLPLMNRLIPIVADPFVDPKFGSGAVKVTPAHDLNDYEASRRLNLPAVVVINASGRMSEDAGPYRGLDRFECRQRVVNDLVAQGLLEKIEDYEVPIGKCYRCHTIIEPYLSEQWFVKMKPLAEPAIRATREGRVRFIPDRWAKVYLDWLENTKDWCISRQIWWGHRIPVWSCGSCGKVSAHEDDPTACPACGKGPLTQDKDVLDTWFSSALWPFATLGWPDATEDLKTFYPTATLVTARDIIYLWVARMVMTGLAFMGREPYAEVFINPTIQNPEGKRMSKSLGTGIDPLELIDQHGADAVRFGLLWQVTDTQDLRFREERLQEAKHFANKLWNAARFVMMNAGPTTPAASPAGAAPGGGGTPAGPSPGASGPVEDRWILSRTQTVIAEVTRALESYRFGDAAQALYQFLWHEYCDWYIEMVKPRLAAESPTRGVAIATLVRVLVDAIKMLHPFMPFVTEAVWQRLRETKGSEGCGTALLMKAPWPAVEGRLRDAAIERLVEAYVIPAVRGPRDIRNKMNIPRAKSLRGILLSVAREDDARTLEPFRGLIANLAGSKAVQVGVNLPRPPKAGTFALGEGGFGYVPLAGLIDEGAERKRIEGQLAKAGQQLASVQSKLARPDFTDKAPPDVVEKERGRARDLEEQKRKLEEALADLA
jgi:valyl-tRNA synthetase